MKTVDGICYWVGAFIWPWLAGYYIGPAASEDSVLIPVTLFVASFVAWWKIFKFLRGLRKSS